MTAIPEKLKKQVESLRKLALSYPETSADAPWGFISVKVKAKGFVGIKWDKTSFLLSVKLPQSGLDALSLPFAEPTHSGLGKSGWVSARFEIGDKVPMGILEQWIDESYRAVAPKSVAIGTKSKTKRQGRA